MTQTPAGWYPDPEAPPGFTPLLRWWDGYQWTDHRQPPPTSVGTGGRTTTDGRVLAGWWRRVLASIVDTFVCTIAGFLVTFPVQVEYQRLIQREVEKLQQGMAEGDPAAGENYGRAVLAFATENWFWFFAVPVVVIAAYHVLFLRWRGATLGKLMLDMRVEPVGGSGRLPWSTIAVRVGLQYVVVWVALGLGLVTGDFPLLTAGYAIVTVFWFVDALWAAGSRRRALHDLAAGTVVVRPR